jgi:nucleoside-diphosphate-sugar epimerase
MRIFLAGATGAIGRRLTPMLVAAGHAVTGATRSADKAAALKAQNVQAVVVDAFDRQALRDAVIAARPDVVIHQLTDLPQVFDPSRRGDMLVRNARLRIEGTANLAAAAQAAGAHRLISQSIAFIYASGPEPHAESDPLAPAEGDDLNALTSRGVRALEAVTFDTPGIDGIVLRYGRLYGPGTWFAEASGRGPLHVDAAAQAALLAVTRGSAGIYNVAEDDGVVATDKARRELGFDPAFRLPA